MPLLWPCHRHRRCQNHSQPPRQERTSFPGETRHAPWNHRWIGRRHRSASQCWTHPPQRRRQVRISPLPAHPRDPREDGRDARFPRPWLCEHPYAVKLPEKSARRPSSRWMRIGPRGQNGQWIPALGRVWYPENRSLRRHRRSFQLLRQSSICPSLPPLMMPLSRRSHPAGQPRKPTRRRHPPPKLPLANPSRTHPMSRNHRGIGPRNRCSRLATLLHRTAAIFRRWNRQPPRHQQRPTSDLPQLPRFLSASGRNVRCPHRRDWHRARKSESIQPRLHRPHPTRRCGHHEKPKHPATSRLRPLPLRRPWPRHPLRRESPRRRPSATASSRTDRSARPENIAATATPGSPIPVW